MRRTELTKRTASRKGFAALGAGAATVFLSFWLWWMFAVVGVPVTAFLTYRWLKFRAEWGLRF